MGDRRGFDPIPLLLGACLAGALAALYLVEPTDASFYPKCPTWSWFGLYCPGCGSLRAMHDLLHGDLRGAMAMNPLLVLTLLPLAHGAWALWRQERTGAPVPSWLTSSRAGWVIVAVLVGYTVLRNLPWFPFALLAPH